jgi:hypothetical protein
MSVIRKYRKLALVTLAGVIALFLATAAFYVLRSWLVAHGYELAQSVYVVVFCGMLGGIYGAFAKLALREAQRLGADANENNSESIS